MGEIAAPDASPARSGSPLSRAAAALGGPERPVGADVLVGEDPSEPEEPPVLPADLIVPEPFVEDQAGRDAAEVELDDLADDLPF